MVHRGHKEPIAQFRVHKDHKDIKVLKGHRVKMVHRGHKV
tara:strand:- start:882 stop:1001 length:120 start_codon:yes stop_codon:yes gene_type:complete